MQDASEALAEFARVGRIVAFTGHRPDKLGCWNPAHPVVTRVKAAIRDALTAIAPSLVISGMALGVDQWAARACVEMEIPFLAALPCDGMESVWPYRARFDFYDLLEQACCVHVVSPGPYKPWKMQRRNEWMVDHCVQLLSVHDGSPGGTANCLEYARNVSRSVLPLSWRE